MTMFQNIDHRETKAQRRIALAGGGTGGHARAALAVGAAYRQLVGDVQILHIGARQGFGFETRLIPEAGERLELIDARPVMGMGPMAPYAPPLPYAPALCRPVGSCGRTASSSWSDSAGMRRRRRSWPLEAWA